MTLLPINTDAFFDELEKIAGVGWDIHGYSKAPEVLRRDMEEAGRLSREHSKKMHGIIGKSPKAFISDKPGFFSRLLGAKEKHKENPKWAAWRKKARAYYKDNPAPRDSWEVMRESRIPTPFDEDTNYKLNMHMDYNRSRNQGSLQKWTTDEAYGTDKVKNLSKADLRKVMKEYSEAAKDYEDKSSRAASGQKAFLSKAKHLLKDPKVKFVRLEYE